MAPIISVIVPVYNGAATLPAAVDSILAQQMPDLEILLVDDGSTDATPTLCARLAAEHPCVRVLRQGNGGISAARNRGLSAAKGAYVTFCDDDDVLLPNALPLLLRTAQAERADVVRGDYELLRQRPDGTFAKLTHPTSAACQFEGQSGYGEFLTQSGPQFVWNALYRRAALASLSFAEDCRYGLEDFIFNATFYKTCRRAVYLPRPVYRHYERLQSTSVDQTESALQGRLAALAPWMQAEYNAVLARCTPKQQHLVWAQQRCAAITFLLHQLRAANAVGPLRRQAWGALRTALAQAPGTPLDILRCVPYNKKQAAALFLFETHLQGLYDLLPNREETL